MVYYNLNLVFIVLALIFIGYYNTAHTTVRAESSVPNVEHKQSDAQCNYCIFYVYIYCIFTSESLFLLLTGIFFPIPVYDGPVSEHPIISTSRHLLCRSVANQQAS